MKQRELNSFLSQNSTKIWKIEKDTIESAISACEGNVNKAAGLLEVAPSTLYRKLRFWKENQDSTGTK